jgi:hypothetical protein
MSIQKNYNVATWMFCGAGVALCCIGTYQFYKTVYEKNRRIIGSVSLMIAGVILIGIGTAKYFNLINY